MVTIRSAVVADLPAIVDLWNREGGPSRHAGQIAEATHLLERDPEALLIGEMNNEIVASLIVGWDGWRCHLYRLAVDPTVRRSGVAQALVQAAAGRARNLGAPRIDAMVDPDNSDAISFWTSTGFELDEDRRWSIFLQDPTT